MHDASIAPAFLFVNSLFSLKIGARLLFLYLVRRESIVMLHFLSSVFSTGRGQGDGPDKALIERAIERVVDGTDPRLRGLGNYRKRLRPAVEQAVVYVIDLVDAMPEPVEISRRAYSTDPRLRAFFVSPTHLQEVIGHSKLVTAFLREVAGPPPDKIFGLLSMDWAEKHVLGIELVGDILRRDVPQVAVSFFNHRFVGPGGSEAETRKQLKLRVFDYLVGEALKSIVTARGKRSELQQQQRLLKHKMNAMKAGDWGLEGMLAATEAEPLDHAALESEIAAIEAELLELGAASVNLDAVFEAVDATLGRPADWISGRELTLNLDASLIKADASSSRTTRELKLNEIYSCEGARRVVLPGWFPRQDLPERVDFLQQAARYLQ
jgi:hypothetical protein